MKLRVGWKSWVFMGVAVVLAGAALGQILVEEPEKANALPVGPAASDFSLDSLDGSVVRLSDNEGRVILINFWATWCMPCLYELPHIQKLYDRYREKGLTVLAVSTDFDRARVGPFIQEYGYTFPVLFADPGIQADYAVRSIPTTFLVDRKGRLRFMQTGYGPDTETELEWALAQLLGR